MKNIYLIALASLIIILSGCSKDAKDTAKEATLTPNEAKQIAKEAFLRLSFSTQLQNDVRLCCR
ncbi:MAG: hypothetical protein ACN4GR_01870 [Arenicellales bacterium]